MDEADYREAQITEPAYRAADVIDDYAQAEGEYHWQVAVINLNADGDFDSLSSEWSAIQTLYRVR